MNKEILHGLKRQYDAYKNLGDKTIERLTETQLNHLPEKDNNSIAMLVKHLHGNMLSRWTDFLTSDGEKPWRTRDQEFEEEKLSKEKIAGLWKEGWDCFYQAFGQISPFDLNRKVLIRGKEYTVYDALVISLAHYAYHVGQMVYLGKKQLGENWETLSVPKKKK
jgi:hypothetical protein